MLSPLWRKGGNVEQATASETNISKDTPDEGILTDSGDPCAANMVANSVNKDGTDSAAPPRTTLPLLLVDENNACIDLSMGGDKGVKLSPSSTILVYIDWSHKLLEKYDTYTMETLPEVIKYGPVTKKARSEPPSLYTCLEAFLREEPLVPEDMWYCPRCKERRQASKKLDLWRLPEVLVIHLKRFSYSRSMKHKLETFVHFPIHDFDLTNHYGSMGSGHYTAHIKVLDENKWYDFDDSHISSVTVDEVNTAAAYVLFYRRVKTDGTTVSNGA